MIVAGLSGYEYSDEEMSQIIMGAYGPSGTMTKQYAPERYEAAASGLELVTLGTARRVPWYEQPKVQQGLLACGLVAAGVLLVKAKRRRR